MSNLLNSTECVRSSCAAFTSPVASVEKTVVDIFAQSLNVDVIDCFAYSSDGLATNRFEKEINFASVDAESGFLMIAHGLDFGSGFRYLLHEHRNGCGAWLTIRAGLVNMGQVNPSFSSDWLSSLQLGDVQKMFDLDATTAAEEALRPLAEQLLTSIHEFGRRLSELGYTTPGEYVAAKLIEGQQTPAVHLVGCLVADFPLTFDDNYCLSGQQVYLYKKAQLVVSEIYMRFFKEEEKYCFSDIDQLTAFVDNVVVAMMRLTGCIKCSNKLANKIESGVYLLRGSEEEVALRAAALHATELIVQKVNALLAQNSAAAAVANKKPMNAQRLCNWLWGCLGKQGVNRKFVRHLAPSTSFY